MPEMRRRTSHHLFAEAPASSSPFASPSSSNIMSITAAPIFLAMANFTTLLNDDSKGELVAPAPDESGIGKKRSMVNGTQNSSSMTTAPETTGISRKMSFCTATGEDEGVLLFVLGASVARQCACTGEERIRWWFSKTGAPPWWSIFIEPIILYTVPKLFFVFWHDFSTQREEGTWVRRSNHFFGCVSIVWCHVRLLCAGTVFPGSFPDYMAHGAFGWGWWVYVFSLPMVVLLAPYLVLVVLVACLCLCLLPMVPIVFIVALVCQSIHEHRLRDRKSVV